jgi:hypothetical protein
VVGCVFWCVSWGVSLRFGYPTVGRYNKRELLGKNIKELVPEPMAGQHHAYMEAFVGSGRSMVCV